MGKTLKRRLIKYLHKKDICCETDYDRNVIIQQIIEIYKKSCKEMGEPDEYLNWMTNDLLILVGYKSDMIKANDLDGVKLWEKLDRKMMKDNKADMNKVVEVLKKVPLYFLLSFLGSACYKEKLQSNI